MSAVPGEISRLCLEWHPVGSRVTCNPPPTDTDADFLLLVDEARADEARADEVRTLILQGFQLDGSDLSDVVLSTPEETHFNSYSDGEVNLVLTTSRVFFSRFLAATSVAKRLNLLRKDDRIALFQAVLYGNAAEAGDSLA